MNEPHKKTVVVPEGPVEQEPPGAPLVAWLDPDDDGRDVSKPVCYDEHGRALYAPRGLTVRLW
jgi:hypothetical protein